MKIFIKDHIWIKVKKNNHPETERYNNIEIEEIALINDENLYVVKGNTAKYIINKYFKPDEEVFKLLAEKKPLYEDE